MERSNVAAGPSRNLRTPGFRHLGNEDKNSPLRTRNRAKSLDPLGLDLPRFAGWTGRHDNFECHSHHPGGTQHEPFVYVIRSETGFGESAIAVNIPRET